MYSVDHDRDQELMTTCREAAHKCTKRERERRCALQHEIQPGGSGSPEAALSRAFFYKESYMLGKKEKIFGTFPFLL